MRWISSLFENLWEYLNNQPKNMYNTNKRIYEIPYITKQRSKENKKKRFLSVLNWMIVNCVLCERVCMKAIDENERMKRTRYVLNSAGNQINSRPWHYTRNKKQNTRNFRKKERKKKQTHSIDSRSSSGSNNSNNNKSRFNKDSASALEHNIMCINAQQ